MTVSYPLTLFSTYMIRTTRFQLVYRQTFSRTGDNKSTAVDRGYPVWVGSFESVPLEIDDCIDMEAMLNSLGGMNQLILCRDTRREYPRAYPTGSFTDAASILAVDGDGIRLSLTGLPANFVLSRGDYFSMIYGSRRYLLQAAEAITADGSGVTGLFQTSPNPPYGLAPGQTIMLKLPAARMRVEPDTIAFSDNNDGTGTVSFSAVQV